MLYVKSILHIGYSFHITCYMYSSYYIFHIHIHIFLVTCACIFWQPEHLTQMCMLSGCDFLTSLHFEHFVYDSADVWECVAGWNLLIFLLCIYIWRNLLIFLFARKIYAIEIYFFSITYIFLLLHIYFLQDIYIIEIWGGLYFYYIYISYVSILYFLYFYYKYISYISITNIFLIFLLQIYFLAAGALFAICLYDSALMLWMWVWWPDVCVCVVCGRIKSHRRICVCVCV